MKFTKHSQMAIGPAVDGVDQLLREGATFSFPDYPELVFFIYRHPRILNWYICESESGMKAGQEYEDKTRVAAIAAQHLVLERMRNSPRGKGLHSYVNELFKTGKAALEAKSHANGAR